MIEEKRKEKEKEKEINNYNVYYLCDKIYVKKELKKEKYNKELKKKIIEEDEYVFKVSNRLSLTLKKLIFNSAYGLIEPIIKSSLGEMSVTALLINQGIYISFNNISSLMYFNTLVNKDEDIYECTFKFRHDKILSCLLNSNQNILEQFEHYKSINNYNTMITNGYYSMNKDNQGTSYNLDYSNIEEQLEDLKSELWSLEENYTLFLDRIKIIKEINKEHKGFKRNKELKIFKNKLKHKKEKYYVREIEYLSNVIEHLEEQILRNSDEFQESESYYLSATYRDI